MALMRSKLGLLARQEEGDVELISELLEAMRTTGSDFTNTFRLLVSFPMASDSAGGGQRQQLQEGDLNGGGNGGHLGGEGDGEQQVGVSSGDGVNGAATKMVMETILAGRAESRELAHMAVSRMPAASLHMLSMLLHRDPALLHALGTSPQVAFLYMHSEALQSCCIA